jgi:hypothetical protein
MSSLSKNLRDLAALVHADVSVADEAADEIERLRAENERLREALECLNDEQNGPPLLGHERSWCAAMEKARAALGEEKK